MLLTEYDIQYITPKAIKWSVISDYLAHQPVEGYQSMRFDFTDENILFIRDYEVLGPGEGPEPGSRLTLMFDDASNAQEHGIGEIITSPNGFHLPSLQDYISTAPTIWKNMKHVSSKLN